MFIFSKIFTRILINMEYFIEKLININNLYSIFKFNLFIKKYLQIMNLIL